MADPATAYTYDFVTGALPDGAEHILEIGCGDGALAARLRAEGYALVALDEDEAAVEAARALPFAFTLTARAENFLWGRPDLADTIRRLRAFQEAGADVLYAPGLPDLDAIRTVCAAVDRPVNVVIGPPFSVAELVGCGVRRISLGSSLARTALGTLLRAGREIRERGTFSFTADAVPYAEANELLGR